MRRRSGWASLGIFLLVSTLAACGGDDDEPPPRDAGPDIGNMGGRGGAGGSDAGRPDSDASAGGSSGGGGTVDAGPDRSSDGQGGADATMDALPDSRPDADATAVVDSAPDQRDGDGGAVLDARAEDGLPPFDAIDGSDAGSGEDGDAIASDASDGGDVSTGDAGDPSDAGDASSLDASDGALCDDGNAASIDFYHPTYGCGHKFDANPSDADAWITYDAGFHVDVATGLGWAFPAGSRNAVAAAAACTAYSVAGLSSWRIATIDEARSLADGCATTRTGGSCPLEDPSCLGTACGQASPACDSCSGGAGPHSGQYCKVDVAVCTHFHTSSVCTDCGDAGIQDWIYGTSNGNFLPFNSLSGIPTACVATVPNGVPAADGG